MKKTKIISVTPFLYGDPVPVDAFLNRQSIVRRVVGRILAGGQSSALVGQPRTGKTSILIYLSDLATRQKLYGGVNDGLVFSLIDSHLIGSQFTPLQFWRYVLEPIKLVMEESSQGDLLSARYAQCVSEQFSNFSLELLFKELSNVGYRFVLMIDEFDALINHQRLNSIEFFGGLRSLSSRSNGAMAIVIASRQSIHSLNTKTQSINPASSPFFNIFKEFTLGSFPASDVSLLLARAGNVFSANDHLVIRSVAGCHPYLLQVAASALWEAYEDDLETEYIRWTYMCNSIYREQHSHFLDTWQSWSPATKKAFTTISLCETEKLLTDRVFLLEPFVMGLRDIGPEIRDLEAVGLVARDESVRGGWCIESKVMTWWLADELVRTVRSDQSFDKWLQAQEMDNYLTRQEKESLIQCARSVATFLQEGATKFVEIFAEGLGKGLFNLG